MPECYRMLGKTIWDATIFWDVLSGMSQDRKLQNTIYDIPESHKRESEIWE